jgi:hypothetical protein
MYHAQEKLVNTVGSEITGQRGGIHNSVTRINMKPTHMIGGYVAARLRLQLLRNGRRQSRRVRDRPQDERDQLVRQGGDDATLPAEPRTGAPASRNRERKEAANEESVPRSRWCSTSTSASAATPARSPARTSGPTAKASNTSGSTTSRPSPASAIPKDWENQERWKGGWVRRKNGKIVPRQGAKWRILSKIFANPHLPEIDDFYEPYTFEYEWLQAAPELQAQPTAGRGRW